MTEQTDTNDDWLANQEPASYRKDAPLTEESLRDAIDNAPEAPQLAAPKDTKAPHPDARTRADLDAERAAQTAPGGGGRGTSRAKKEIYDSCPVIPLGKRGDSHYFLDALGQMRKIGKIERNAIMSLWGHQYPSLCFSFPKWKRDEDGAYSRVTGAFDADKATTTMHQAVGECGVFNPDNVVRGVGAWTDDDGNLVYHMGDAVLVAGEKQRPGRIGNRIYPAAPPIPHPDSSTTPTDPVPEIQRTLATWNWADPDVQPHLALGMIATQMLCGALDWRPVFWILAAAGAGKSELQRLIALLHGDDGLVSTTDATKSGITSKLGQSSLPVSVDELEPGDERSTKERDIIALARVAASGGEWFRGSADQTGVGGKVYSSFTFSSILIPGVMKPQDVQRLIRLELQPLDKGVPKLNLQPRTWRARGARLKTLLIDRWPTWTARLAAWRHALELEDITGREADNWSTVLAMADMALQEDIAAEDVMASWAKKVAFAAKAGREDTMNDADAMLVHLMSQQIDPFRRGQQYTVAQWVMTAAKLAGAPDGLKKTDDGAFDSPRPHERANVMLAAYGLRVKGEGEAAQLFIANIQLQQLKNLFHGSQWAGGVWAQSAIRVPGAERTPNPLTLSGMRTRGVYMPVRSIPGLMALPMDRDRGAADSGSASDVNDYG